MSQSSFDAVFFIAPGFLTYYDMKQPVEARFDYPPASVIYQEMADPAAFETAFRSFLLERKFVPGKVVLMLAESLVFSEAIAGIMSLADQNVEIENFYKYVPIPKETIIKHVFVHADTTTILAFDKRLPLLINSLLGQTGWQVMLIAPMSVFQTGLGDQIAAEYLKTLLQNEDLLLKSRLPLVTQTITPTTLEHVATKEKNQESDKKRVGLLVACLLCLYSVSMYALFATGVLHLPGNKKIASMSQKKLTIQTSQTTSVPTPAYKPKEALRLRINADSLTASAAAQITGLLREHGFVNTPSESKPIANPNDNVILISRSVSPAVRTELQSTFGPLFPGFHIMDKPVDETFDIVINLH
jgi:hypothetical protein